MDTGGGLRESLNRLDNADNLRQTAVSSLTAGALSYVGDIPLGEKGIKLNDISLAKGSKLNELLGKNLINAAVSAAVESAATGESFEAVLERSAMLALLKTGAAGAAFAIGNSGLTPDMKLALHAALGCVAGALKQGGSAGCAPGALGAVAAEAFANANGDQIRANSTSKEEADNKILEQASLVATGVGCAVGGSAGCGTGGFTGANAVENNYLSHAEATVRAALKDKQAKGTLSAEEQQKLTNLEVLDIARDLALKEACKTPGDPCNAARRDLNAAIGSYAASGGTNNARLSTTGNQSVTAELNQNVALSNDPTLAQQTLWDSFKEFAVPQAAGYVGGAVLGKFIGEAQAVYAAIKAESGAVGAATGTKLPVATDATATSPYSSSGTSYGKTTLTDVNGKPIPAQPTLPSAGVNGGVIQAVDGALPNAGKAVIDPNKFTSYALNPQHPVGGDKARVFESALGYNQSNANELIDKIQQGVLTNPAVLGKADQFGQRLTVDMPITGPNGNTVMVRTGWVLDPGATIPKLATAYVK